jgi:K+-transporting ATPase ATPase C chain
MRKHIRPAIMLTILFVIVTGVIYPGIVTAIAQVVFPSQANGSLVYANGKPVGSELIGQYWTSSKYFHGRPSATSNPSTGQPSPYEADNTTASNLGSTNAKLIENVKNYADQFRKENDLSPDTPLPSDIVTTSASGLDPDISPEAAYLQAGRVARVRHLDANRVKQLVTDHIGGRFLGIFGEPHVNVLDLNLALDRLK